MEKQKPFTLFVPPRLSSSLVSAVKPQTSAGDSHFFKSFNKCIEDDFGFPFALTTLSKNGENLDSDPALPKLNFLPTLEQADNSGGNHYEEEPKDSDCESSEPVSRMYSKLYKEAKKIKKWKVNVEAELKQKENKLQENKKTIEAQRKAIQELQFENERVSLKFNEEILENKELMKENNATRHLCNLLKETCARSAEKTKKYEHEREETRQVHVDLNNTIEKMIIAFEELRVQAENSRLEMHFKLKEDYEKIQQLEEDYKKEVNDKENQVSLLLIQSMEKENKIKDLTSLLEESIDKADQLEEKTKLQDEQLKESNKKKDQLTSELEDMKISWQKTVSTQKALEEDLQIATKTVCELTDEKEAQMEEFKKANANHSFVVTELKTTICNLEELLRTEQQRLEKNEDHLKILTAELQKKSSELEEMTKCKNSKEVELEELKKTLAEDQKLLDEKKQIEKIIEELKGKEQKLTGLLQTSEKEKHNLEIQLTVMAESEQRYLKQVEELKTELEEEKLKNVEITANCNKLSVENKELAQETNDMDLELKKQQEDINDRKKEEERMLKQIENLQKTETQLRSELESVKEELKKGEEIKCKLDVSEENVRKLELELESSKQKCEEMAHSYRKEIEDKELVERNLLGEVDKAKVVADEAVKLQKEMDIRCQHKIAEMVALMEKHKHQYDKIIEEKDSELGRYKSKEHEQSSLRASLEIELSDLKNELLSTKKQLDTERAEKEKLKREAKENIVTLEEKKEKKTQTSLQKTPETNYWKFDCRTTPLQNVSRNFLPTDHGNKSRNKRDLLWTSTKSDLSTPLPKVYTVKTPTKLPVQQREEKTVPVGKNKKKRKMVFEFNSDSSETTDLWSMVSEEETDTLNKLCKNNSPPISHLSTKTPKNTSPPATLSSKTAPGSSLKFGAMRKMRENRWSVVTKMDRKEKLKQAEKLFA
ncbi:synaptonemal complex protein 1 [Ctenodactylus gundi]